MTSARSTFVDRHVVPNDIGMQLCVIITATKTQMHPLMPDSIDSMVKRKSSCCACIIESYLAHGKETAYVLLVH